MTRWWRLCGEQGGPKSKCWCTMANTMVSLKPSVGTQGQTPQLLLVHRLTTEKWPYHDNRMIKREQDVMNDEKLCVIAAARRVWCGK